jgi:hypothetical protein
MGTTIEILLAFAGIMLALSLTITLLNQFVSNILGLRGGTLKWGLVTMLDELHREAMIPKMPAQTLAKVDPETTDKIPKNQPPPVRHADTIAEFVLTHPLISDSSTPISLGRYLRQWRRATALQFGDLQRILQHSVDPSISDDRLAISNAATWSPEEARTWLSRNMAVTKEWFDAIMARVSQRFSMKMRVSTAAFAFFLAFLLHINTFDLLRQLQANPSKVADLNAKLEARISDIDPANQSEEEMKKRTEAVKDLRAQYAASGITIYPEDWRERLPARLFLRGQVFPITGDLKAFLGLFVTAILLSLGAPFWFNQLKNISTLRSIVALKAEAATTSSAQPPMAVLSVRERSVINPKV